MATSSPLPKRVKFTALGAPHRDRQPLMRHIYEVKSVHPRTAPMYRNILMSDFEGARSLATLLHRAEHQAAGVLAAEVVVRPIAVFAADGTPIQTDLPLAPADINEREGWVCLDLSNKSGQVITDANSCPLHYSGVGRASIDEALRQHDWSLVEGGQWDLNPDGYRHRVQKAG